MKKPDRMDAAHRHEPRPWNSSEDGEQPQDGVRPEDDFSIGQRLWDGWWRPAVDLPGMVGATFQIGFNFSGEADTFRKCRIGGL